MRIEGKVCVVTGAAGGIGAALARRFAAEGAVGVVVADVQEDAVRAVAEAIGGTDFVGDMTREGDVQALIELAEETYGAVDVFCSNAGIIRLGGEDAPDAEWQLCWDLHLMAHVYAARLLAPKMAERGDGYFVNTASAAGLLSHPNSATYAVTKHAAVAFAEWLAINYGDKGVKASVLCPQGVQTPMTAGRDQGAASVDGMLTADAVAEAVIAAMDAESFLILPHDTVRDYVRRKADDADRWLAGMRKYKAMFPDGI